MRIVGIRQPGQQSVQVGALSESGEHVTPIAGLDEFWSGPNDFLRRPLAGPGLPLSAVHLVPPVLPDARIFCIGLNYLKHVAEGSYAEQDLPEYPTPFLRAGPER